MMANEPSPPIEPGSARARDNARLLVTIVVPAYNEQDNLPKLRTRLAATLDPLTDYRFEFLVIDNCSTDDTEKIGRAFAQQDTRFRYIRFSRNFGLEGSLHAALEFAEGDALIYLFSDLQDPPEAIPAMLEKWREGNDIVYGVLTKRQDDNWLKSMGAHAAYKLINLLSDVKIPPNATDFRLISRPVIDVLKILMERNRYMRGLVWWTGFRQAAFPYERTLRSGGRSSAGFWFSIGFAIKALVAFSTKPLLLASLVGVGTTSLSVVSAIVYTLLHILSRNGLVSFTPPPTGWTTLILLVLFFGGILSLFIGIIGEYLASTYTETKRRPIWIIQHSSGFNDERDPIKTRRNVS